MGEDEIDQNEAHIDLSWLNLKTFPLTTFEKLNNIQHIYLEGNRIRKLDDNFFPTFQQLQWFDIRNNELEGIPATIANHPSLRVLLLEGNNLQQLLVELGSLPNLRGIQSKRNPIEYPPPEILSQGSSTIIKFLQDEWNSLQAEIEPNTSCLVKSSSKTSGESRKAKHLSRQRFGSANNDLELHNSKMQSEDLNECMKVMKLEKFEAKKKSKMAISLSTCNPDTGSANENSEGDVKKENNGISEYKQDKIENSPNLPDYEKTISDLDDERSQTHISSKMLRDMWLYNIRRVLEEQEAELQKQRDKDSLKKWQQETKEIQQTFRHKPDEMPHLEMPFGIDEELTMPSRKDLHSMEKKGKARRKVSRGSEYSGHDSISSKINSVLHALQELRKKRLDRSLSPRAEQETLAAEIKKITELQRTLASLKHVNYMELSSK